MAGQLTLDGRTVTFREGQTLLEVARENNVKIPSLCYHRKTGPVGRCRLCVVEVERQRTLVTACTAAAQDGQVVRTNTERVREARRTIINLLLSSGEHNCLSCEQSGACELQDAAYQLQVEAPAFLLSSPPLEVDTSAELIVVDRRKCILCGRCVAACNHTVVNEVLGVGERSLGSHILFDIDRPIGRSTCVQCGECVQICPVGALIDKRAIRKGRATDLEKVDSTCPHCGIGCQVTLHVDRAKNRIVRVTGREVEPNDGMLCVKGRYGFESPHAGKRLTQPMIRRNGALEPVSWDECLDYVAGRLQTIVGQHGPDVFSACGSDRITNENNYALAKFARAVIKTNNVDHAARPGHAPTVTGLATSFGSGAMTNSIPELQDAKVIFVIGSDLTEAHPVVSYYVKRAVKKGAILIVNDPRRIDLCRWATHHVPLKSGAEIAYINGLIHEIFRNGWADEEFLKAHTENAAEIRQWVEAYPVERASEICGVPVPQLTQIARILGTGGSASVCCTLDTTEHACGADTVKALANLQMVLGNLGKPNCGLNPLLGQNNAQGACDMGALPDVYHGNQPVADARVRAKMEQAWGVTGLSDRPGHAMPTMLRKALDGGTRILYCVGDNSVQTEPDQAHALQELQALELLIVSDSFPSLTTERAHVVLPGCAWGEEEGTFSSTERRVQRVRAALEAPGGCRPSWWVLQQLGQRLGCDLGFTSAEAVWEDMRRTATTYAGISYARLEGVGLQWPCPTPEHPGTVYLHQDGKFTRGRALFAKTDRVPSAEDPHQEQPSIRL